MTCSRFCLQVTLVLLNGWLISAGQSRAQSAQDLLRQVFGDEILLDSGRVAQVKRDSHGKRHWFDTNGDGRANECWYICIEPRHQKSHTPLLVRVVDEDGDMDVGIQGDRDSDLYIADWGATGTIDAIADHEDLDGDNDVDRMGLYYQLGNSRRLRVWFSIDDGDDNLLWWDQGFRYYQTPGQHHTHFGGDETFINYQWDDNEKLWVPLWEAPFLFYDNRDDGVTDEVVRIEPSTPTTMGRLRWSFDVDGDAALENPRDFDVSISAHPYPGMTFPGEAMERFTIRGYPTGATLARDAARDWLRTATFQTGLFTWVENDHNVGWNGRQNREDQTYPHERWEGVLANGQPGFAQIGGPPAGPFNNRQEAAFDRRTEAFGFYFHPATHRIHLRDASSGWLVTDYNGDFRGEMRYEYLDLNPRDGLYDRVTLDIDHDGVVDDSWEIDTQRIVEIPFVRQDFHDAYAPVLENNPGLLYVLDRKLAAALESVTEQSSTDPVWELIESRFAGMEEHKRVKLLHSDMAMIYYLELVRDRRIHKLKAMAGDKVAFWRAFNAARSAGELAVMSDLLESHFTLPSPAWPNFADWTAKLRDERGRFVEGRETGSGQIGWESEKVAYRFENGKIDFLGKREQRLVLADALGPVDTDTGGWGMDALDAGASSGCGGLTLFINGTAYPLRTDGGGTVSDFQVGVVQQSPAAVTIEALATGVGPTDAPRDVRMRASIFAGRAASAIEVRVEGGVDEDQLELGVGFTRLNEQVVMEDEAAGSFGIWGFQRPEIGWIGIGMIYPAELSMRRVDLEHEHLVVLPVTPRQPLRYQIQADWLRGRRFPVRPSAADWLIELNRLTAD